MRAVGHRAAGPLDGAGALEDLELPAPTPGERDLLVDVRAVSVNPVDTKVRATSAPPEGEVRVLGWDAAGVVAAVGPGVRLFTPGDRVYYAGSISRPGSNSEQQVVDERIVGRMPSSLDFAQAAALPLTTITAWELLHDRLELPRDDVRSLLVLGAAGGVGSILLQLATRMEGLRVIGTASRPQSAAWVRELGAHDVIDHSRSIPEQVAALGVGGVEAIASLTHTEQHWAGLVEALAPQGRLALIDDPVSLDVGALKSKAASLHWEFMFTRPLFGTSDLQAQHDLLGTVADLVDAGELRTTLGENLGAITAANLSRAHAHLETGRAVGKVVLEGF